MIHPTAVVHPKADLDPSIEIGPYAVIDAGVRIGPRCCVGPHVHITGNTIIGEGNQFHSGTVIGDAPQDLRYKGEPTQLLIGNGNVFREHVTVHRSSNLSEPTRIGSKNFLMAHCHVGHNAEIGDQVIIANGALLGGHTVVGNRAFISGNCLVHQFVRIGTLALMQGGSAISKDLPPFTIARGDNGICGLNTVGLRRAGLESAIRLELRAAYQALFRSNKRLKESIHMVHEKYRSEAVQILLQFVTSSKRGICADVSRTDLTGNVETGDEI